MPKYDNTAEPLPSLGSDDVDLIDMIAFLWRSKTAIVGGILSGVALAGVIWTIAHLGNRPVEKAGDWTASFQANKGEEPRMASLTLNLNSYLKTQSGAQSFYEAIDPEKKNSVDQAEWAVKQINGQGMIKAVEFNGSAMTVALQNLGSQPIEDFKQSFPLALNAAIRSFNKNIADINNRLNQDQLNAQMQLANTKLKILKLFNKYSNPSSALQKQVVEGVVKDISNTAKPEPLIFLLATVPDSDTEKATLLREFQKISLELERLDAMRRNLSRSLGVDDLVPLTELSKPSTFAPVTNKANVGVKIFERLPNTLIFGAAMGAILGTLYAVVSLFWRHNRRRFQTLIHTAPLP